MSMGRKPTVLQRRRSDVSSIFGLTITVKSDQEESPSFTRKDHWWLPRLRKSRFKEPKINRKAESAE